MALGMVGGIPSIAGSIGGASPIGWASMGLNALGGLGKMFGRSKMESSSAVSGVTNINGDITMGNSGINNPIIDLSNPVHVGILLSAVGLAVLIYKKVK